MSASLVGSEMCIRDSYCALTKNGLGTSLTVLVLEDRSSRAILAHPAPRKGRLRGDTVGQAVSSGHRLGRRRK
eukprot:2356041-Alexandrium_andersonii.AAC.1